MKFLKLVLSYLGLKKKPTCLNLLEYAPRVIGTDKRIAEMTSKSLSLLYWFEIFHPKGVFKRVKEDAEDPEKRFAPIFALLDGCINYGAELKKVDELKALLMYFAAKTPREVENVQEVVTKRQIKFQTFNSIVTPSAAIRGYWNG